MPIVSKTVEVSASAEAILAIVADFEAYPQWNEEIKGCWILARYDDGRPSQLRLDATVNGYDITYIQAIYYPGENQIQTVMQQGDLFAKQEQLFSVAFAEAMSASVERPTRRGAPALEPEVGTTRSIPSKNAGS